METKHVFEDSIAAYKLARAFLLNRPVQFDSQTEEKKFELIELDKPKYGVN